MFTLIISGAQYQLCKLQNSPCVKTLDVLPKHLSLSLSLTHTHTHYYYYYYYY